MGAQKPASQLGTEYCLRNLWVKAHIPPAELRQLQLHQLPGADDWNGQGGDSVGATIGGHDVICFACNSAIVSLGRQEGSVSTPG